MHIPARGHCAVLLGALVTVISERCGGRAASSALCGGRGVQRLWRHCYVGSGQFVPSASLPPGSEFVLSSLASPALQAATLSSSTANRFKRAINFKVTCKTTFSPEVTHSAHIIVSAELLVKQRMTFSSIMAVTRDMGRGLGGPKPGMEGSGEWAGLKGSS